MKHATYFDSARVRLRVSEKSLNRLLQLRSEDSQVAANLNYRLISAVAKKRRGQNKVVFRRQQLLSVRFNAAKYRQRLPRYIERFTADVTDVFNGFLSSIRTEVQEIVEEQRRDILSTLKRFWRPLMPSCGVLIESSVGLDPLLSIFDNEWY